MTKERDDSWTPPRSALRPARRFLAEHLSGSQQETQPPEPSPAPLSGPLPKEVEAASRDSERVFGRYVFVEAVGRGAMGKIWKSWDTQLGRWVAVKVMREESLKSQRPRFLREARSAAILRHPNLVTVHDAGEHRGMPYLVMELVKGRPLDFTKGARTAASALAKVLDALGEAHRNGVVHRDVKPGNILVDERGEPRVVDFGLAHLEDASERLTRTGSALGTPFYMSPEQVQGQSDRIGPATDVYAVGAMLYEALSGRPPHVGTTLGEVYQKILTEEPRKPEGPSDLVRICLQALDKRPRARYGTAGSMAADLRRYLAGETVEAKGRSQARRFWRAVTSRWSLFAMAGVFAAIMIAVVLVMTARMSHAERTKELWTRVSAAISEAEILSRAGRVREAHDRLEEGILHCRKFLEAEESAEARYFVGKLLVAGGRPDEGLSEFDAAVRLDPELGEARLERGLIRVDLYSDRLWMLRKYAWTTVEEVEALHSSLRELRLLAEQDLSVKTGRSPYFRLVDARFGQAELLWVRGDWTQARAELEDILKGNPLHTRAQVSLGKVLIHEEEFDQAIGVLDEAIRQNRGFWHAYYTRAFAHCYAVKGQADTPEEKRHVRSALEDLEKIIEMGHASADVYAERGFQRELLGRWTEAIRDFDEALRRNPGLLEARVNRAAVLSELGRMEEACRELEDVIRTDPRLDIAYYNLARIHHGVADDQARKGEEEQAVAMWMRALEGYLEAGRLNPGLQPALFNAGNIYLSLAELHLRHRRYDEALKVLDSAIEVYGRVLMTQIKEPDALTNRAAARLRKAKICQILGDRRMRELEMRGAAADYEAALECAPPDWKYRTLIRQELEKLSGKR